MDDDPEYDDYQGEIDEDDFELRSCGGLFAPGTEQCDWCKDYDLCRDIEAQPRDRKEGEPS